MSQFTLYDWKYGIKKRKLESVTRDGLKACQRKKERLLTGYLENSKEGTTSYSVSDDSGNWTKTLTGGDGDPLISATHAREDGGANVCNEVTDGTTVNMDFDTLGLKGMFYTASLIKDGRGNLMDINPTLLAFRKGSSIAFKAMEINGALKTGRKPESADRDGSPFTAFEVLELPYLTTTASAYWWGFDTSLMSYDMGLQIRMSQQPMMDSPETDYKTKSIYVTSTFAMDYGHNDYRNALGSDGTNA